MVCLGAGRRLLIEKAWVGPPATINDTSTPGSAGALPTSTTSTVSVSAMPSAIARATCSVLPHIDS